MAGKDGEENGVRGGFQFRKYEERTKWQSFQNAIYNPSTGEILGRTGKNWSQLLIFYTIFYIILAALFAICMQGLLATLDLKEPKYKLDDSLIGTNPGLGFRPISNKTEEGSLIWYNLKNVTTSEKWEYLIDQFLQNYKGDQTGQNYMECNFGKPADKGHVCSVVLDVKSFGPCAPKNSYGYRSSSPCVFLKLNKIFGWTPKFYTTPQKDMPDDLIEKIKAIPSAEREQVWVSCRGEGPIDKEHVTQFEYFPTRGFAGYYFPYTNEDNYLSPIIAVQILNPQPSVVISIECRAWAENINYHGGDLNREGSIHFEILLDDKNVTKVNGKTAM